MLTFEQADKQLSGRCQSQRKIGNNTLLVRVDEDTIAVRLYRTNVVTMKRNGQYILNSGGFQTVTTKARINEYGPVLVYQKDFQWYIKQGEYFFQFVDGMVV